jgi:hypothetical protein
MDAIAGGKARKPFVEVKEVVEEAIFDLLWLLVAFLRPCLPILAVDLAPLE